MSEIVIDPITRIEGHSKITIQLDEAGAVTDAHFHVTQFRGFERICEGRPLREMPSLMARICGICPVSHLMASAKACDEILAVTPPEAALQLRRVMNLAQIVQSHALSFFHLSSPDLLFGFDADPARRNLFGVAADHPQLARDGIALRRFGQQIIERLGGKRIHPAWVVAGGVSRPLATDERDDIIASIPEARAAARRTIDWYKAHLADWAEEASTFAEFPSLYVGLVHGDGSVAYSDGALRVVDGDGHRLADDVDPRPYWDYLGEAVEPWSYLKSAYWKAAGYPEGLYRVGPLARLNVIDRLGTEEADAELAEYRQRLGRYPSSSFHYHYARLVEIVHCIDAIAALLESPDILDEHVLARADVNRNEGVGVAEAPRGTLIHHYRVDDDGLIRWVNLVIATGHNNLAMNRGVLEVARRYVDGQRLTEGMLNRVEAVIRCYDPCLSCSTHALGQMALRLQLIGPDGAITTPSARWIAADSGADNRRRVGAVNAGGVLVVGYGNTLRGDDAVGPRVAELLASRSAAPGCDHRRSPPVDARARRRNRRRTARRARRCPTGRRQARRRAHRAGGRVLPTRRIARGRRQRHRRPGRTRLRQRPARCRRQRERRAVRSRRRPVVRRCVDAPPRRRRRGRRRRIPHRRARHRDQGPVGAGHRPIRRAACLAHDQGSGYRNEWSATQMGNSHR